ncbi:hypothetical protein BU15DRAFT_77176 [Melanogaster broomeanus]|nr:hypothetical protein BU15DRAFT_77176 [Melanogaster broomeanus]
MARYRRAVTQTLFSSYQRQPSGRKHALPAAYALSGDSSDDIQENRLCAQLGNCRFSTTQFSGSEYGSPDGQANPPTAILRPHISYNPLSGLELSCLLWQLLRHTTQPSLPNIGPSICSIYQEPEDTRLGSSMLHCDYDDCRPATVVEVTADFTGSSSSIRCAADVAVITPGRLTFTPLHYGGYCASTYTLKDRLKAYAKCAEPFYQQLRPKTETRPRSRVELVFTAKLQALTLKIFSPVPISIPDRMHNFKHYGAQLTAAVVLKMSGYFKIVSRYVLDIIISLRNEKFMVHWCDMEATISNYKRKASELGKTSTLVPRLHSHDPSSLSLMKILSQTPSSVSRWGTQIAEHSVGGGARWVYKNEVTHWAARRLGVLSISLSLYLT